MPAQHPSSSKQSHLAPIPDGLQKQLDTFRKKLWQVKIAEAFLAGCAGLLLSFLIVFLLDRFFETPPTLRLVILLSGSSLIGIFAPYWIHRWVYRHRHENQLARLISARFPRLGDRLLGAVELQDQNERRETLSPQLRAAAMRTVASDAAKVDLSTALPNPQHRKWLSAVISLLVISVLLMALTPEASINSLKRWLMPYAKTERFTFTRLDLSAISTPERIPFGEAFSLEIPLAKDTGNKPRLARARYGNGEWIEAPLSNDTYTFNFPGQRAQDVVTIEAHDARHSLPFEPVMRPEVQSIHASVKLPEYLQRPDQNSDLRSGYITLVEGSSMKVVTTTTRKLLSGHADLKTMTREGNYPASPQTEDSQTQPLQDQEPAPMPVELELKDRTLTSADIPIAMDPLLLTVHWRDIYRLGATNPFQIRIEPVHDLAPSSYMQGIDRGHIMLAEETVQFEIIAQDDYGLKSCGIAWEGSADQSSSGKPAQGELTLQKGGPTHATMNAPFSFSPANLNIEPQKIILRSWAEDYKPGRGRVYSEPLVIFILSPHEHAQVLKNQFDSAIGELEDIARKEQNLNDENLRTERKMGKDLQDDTLREKLRRQQDGEATNRERMQDLAERMEDLFKDAVRNGEVEKQTLQKMADALQSMKELAGQDLPEVEKKLQDAQDRRNTNEKSQQDLREAIAQQEKAIEKMNQALEKANEANQMFEAGTFVNRLKRAARTQESIAHNIIEIIDEVIGYHYGDLDPVEQRAMRRSHVKQSQNANVLRWIHEDLGHYYSRTQRPEHKELHDIIRESMIDQKLDDLAKQIEANISYSAIVQSKYWAEEIKKWVAKLEGEKMSGGGGGAGGGGGSQQDQDFEFMLKVMRMIQKEQDIRARTRALEDMRRALQIQNPQTN
ncbi:MAG: hypothetical protein ACPH5P_01960 [Akkermansiaceae bacterium]